MKNNIITIGIALMGALTLAGAQTNLPPANTLTNLASTPLGAFPQVAYNWFTTAQTGDPAETWTNAGFEFNDGYSQVTGSGAVDVVEAQYDWANGALAGAKGTFNGVGSAFNGGGVFGGYAILRYYSVKLDADLGANWNSAAAKGRGSWEAEPRLLATKYLTEVTEARVGVGEPVEFRGKNSTIPEAYVEFGFPLHVGKY